MAQTLCYDLARAEKAKDGKKSLLIPQRGNDARCCTIRATGTNTVLRPGESREGDGRKKKCQCVSILLEDHLLFKRLRAMLFDLITSARLGAGGRAADQITDELPIVITQLRQSFFCSNASMASARSLSKFLLVVLIHAREAGTEVKASCANNDKKKSP